MKYIAKIPLMAMVLLAVCFSNTNAQGGDASGLGIRAGLGLNPDQFVVGAQFSIGKKAGIARIVPSVDLGFGDNVTTIVFNADFLFRLRVEDTNFGLYGGGSPTLVFYDFEGGSNWDFGVTGVVGIELNIIKGHPNNLELRLGIGDVPDLRLLLTFML